MFFTVKIYILIIRSISQNEKKDRSEFGTSRPGKHLEGERFIATASDRQSSDVIVVDDPRRGAISASRSAMRAVVVVDVIVVVVVFNAY